MIKIESFTFQLNYIFIYIKIYDIVINQISLKCIRLKFCTGNEIEIDIKEETTRKKKILTSLLLGTSLCFF